MENTLTIFNTAVKMESQEQCDRMKQVCLDNELPILEDEIAFELDDNYVHFGQHKSLFAIWLLDHLRVVSESEWLSLLEQYKSESIK